MNTKTNFQFNVSNPTNTQRSVNSVTFRVASVHRFITHLRPVSRGFTMLLVLVLVAIPSLTMLFPHTVTPVSASPGQFSA